ncbi:unnamed protein product [Cylindrotheca closterium]|uniref:Uncharacterized protein n=1 Tax=Cylindrotheca closterium TaxID=2856 RepID=A0AAD2JKZ7_9STRA|nr:unnamed protein product [Cylindrotheca closterium]
MTITDFTVRKKSYRYLTTQGSYPNHDSKAVLNAFDPTKDLQLQDLNSLVKKGTQRLAKRKSSILINWLDHDVLENGSDPLAFSWPAKAFSKTHLVKVPKLEAWMINEELEQDCSKLFVMENITDEDPETAYNLLVTPKRMPISQGDLGYHLGRIVRTQSLAIGEVPALRGPLAHGKNGCRERSAFKERQRTCCSHCGLDSENSTGDSTDKTYELLTKTLAAIKESNKTTKNSVESLSEVVVAGIQGQASDKAPPNTVEKKWPTRLSYLKRVAGTTTSAQLPILWHELAKCKKHESIGIVQSLLDNEAKKLNLNLEFIVSARVIKSLKHREVLLNIVLPASVALNLYPRNPKLLPLNY